MNITQGEDFSCSVDAKDKLLFLEPYPLTRTRCHEVDKVLNTVEQSSFMSLNASIGELGHAASSLCAFRASYLQ